MLHERDERTRIHFLYIEEFLPDKGARRGNHCKDTSRVTAETLPTLSALKKQNPREEYCVDPRLAKDYCIASVAERSSSQEEGWTQRDHVRQV